MKLSKALTFLIFSILGGSTQAQDESTMVKMCLFYDNASGHARSDPILNQVCPSDHVHTFYGPQNFHPNTSYEQLRDTKPQYSTSLWVENQSLYWHPSIYEVTQVNGETKYNRLNNLETSPYYRWHNPSPTETVAFRPGFRMIAYSNQEGADRVGDIGGSLLVECCNYLNGGEEEDCTNTFGPELIFPKKTCDFLGIGFAMPTCWNESKGIGIGDPFSHVAYTTDGSVNGPCPNGYNKRVPQIQLFIRINNYRGATSTYQLADGNNVFHVDFMNGWQEGKMQQILNECLPTGDVPCYNPPCDCTQFLTENPNPAQPVCDNDVKRYILNEDTDVVSSLPRGTCQGPGLIDKSWTVDPPFQCSNNPLPTGSPTVAPIATPTLVPNSAPTASPTQSPTPAPTPAPTSTPTSAPVSAPTSAPTPGNSENEDCEDSELDFEVADGLYHCDDVAENPEMYCNFPGVPQHCPVTCDALEYCGDDSINRFALYENYNKRRDCEWAADNVERRCRKADLCNTCRATCAGYDSCTYVDDYEN